MAQSLNATGSPEPAFPAQQQSRSHGRGGAGNMNSKPGVQLDASALETPTIKQQTYTTGRGGTGNMAVSNPNDPSEARLAQDVEAPKAHEREVKGTYHWGRGGEGNMMTFGGSNTSDTKAAGSSNHAKADSRPANPVRSTSKGAKLDKERRGSFRDAVDKGKELLGLGGARKAAATTSSRDEAAVE